MALYHQLKFPSTFSECKWMEGGGSN